MAELIVHGLRNGAYVESVMEKAKLVELSQEMNRACFVITKLRNARNLCLTCVSAIQEALVLSTGRTITNQNEELIGGTPVVLYFNYLFKNGAVDWSDTKEKCGLKCGSIAPQKSLTDCHPSIYDNFYLPT